MLKKPKNGGRCTFIWIAVDRESGKVIDFEVGDRTKDTYLTLAFRIEKKYKINRLCADNYVVYKYYKISNKHHTTKSETSLVESINSLLRNYLARFNRRTKRYSKSARAIVATLVVFFNQDLLSKLYL